jgi:hypothetical protein
VRTLAERRLVPRQLLDVTPPDTIAGLVCWLDAEDITGLSDGDGVSAWADRSGYGNNFSQATAARQPLWYDTAPEGPMVRFDHGTSSHGMISDTSLSFSTWSVMLVIKKSTHSVNTMRRIIQGASNNYLIGPYGATWTAYSGAFSYTPEPVASNDAGTGPPLRFQCVGVTHVADTSLHFYIDGRSYSFTPGSTEIGVVALGASGGTDQRASCDLFGAAMYDRALTATEMRKLTSYYRTRLGYQ